MKKLKSIRFPTKSILSPLILKKKNLIGELKLFFVFEIKNEFRKMLMFFLKNMLKRLSLL